MEAIPEQLIADFHERDLPAFTRRHIQLPWLSNKIDTVISMRRSGKAWFLFQVISDLLSNKYPKESILYLNLEDERLLPLKTKSGHIHIMPAWPWALSSEAVLSGVMNGVPADNEV